MKITLSDFFGWLATAIVGAVLICHFAGCKSFYENAGSHTKVGALTAPVEVSDGTDSITVRALYSMDGADVYTAKDSLVKIHYTNTYTNSCFAIYTTHGRQDLTVEIEPLATDGATQGETQEAQGVTNAPAALAPATAPTATNAELAERSTAITTNAPAATDLATTGATGDAATNATETVSAPDR